MKIIGAYCADARDITGARNKGCAQKRKHAAYKEREKGNARRGGTRGILTRGTNDRPILIPAIQRNEASEEIHFSPAPLIIPFSVSYLRLPYSRERFPWKCARGDRSVEQGSTGTRLPPLFPLFLFLLSYRTFISAGSYMPRNIYRFPIIRTEALPPPPEPARGRAGPNMRSNTPLKIHSVVRCPPSPADPSTPGPFSVVRFLLSPAVRGGLPQGVCSINIFIPF